MAYLSSSSELANNYRQVTGKAESAANALLKERAAGGKPYSRAEAGGGDGDEKKAAIFNAAPVKLPPPRDRSITTLAVGGVTDAVAEGDLR